MTERSRSAELSAAEWATLGLLAERPTHGYELARLLAHDGPVGQVWTVPKALVYRAVTTLQDDGLIEVVADQPSDTGPRRTLLRATRSGRARLRRWLAQPVPHVRDIRPLFLFKLVLLDRAGASPARLLAAQRTVMEEVIADLEGRADDDGVDHLLRTWRIESAHAVVRFVDGL